MARLRSASALTYSVQDYLKTIFELTESGEPASTNAIASRLGISPASVTGMLQKLSAFRPPLVTYKKHQGARLTTRGRRAALQVVRHHRLLETWLAESLGYSWDEVHGEAEKLEHVVSDDLERRISRALGNPSRDPHGELIPSADLVMPRDASIPLSELQEGQEAVVRRVQARDALALRRLHAIGMFLGSTLEVIRRSKYDEVMTLRVDGQPTTVTLGPALTSRVYVEQTPKLDKGK